MARIQVILLTLLVVAVSAKSLNTAYRTIQACDGDCAQVQYGEVQTGVGILSNHSIPTAIPLPPIFKTEFKNVISIAQETL
jgi:hypothetical protein